MDLLLPVILFGGLIALVYLQSKKQKRMIQATRDLQDSLVPGTRVMTTSGLQGEVFAVHEETIELEIAPGVVTTWVKAAVRELVVAPVEEFEDEAPVGVVLDKSDNKDS